jgi:hypothetical protein
MPNHEWVKVLRARVIELSEEVDAIGKLLVRYDDVVPPPSSFHAKN